MFTSLEFENFRILRDAKIPLGRLTILLGPNGSGKSTALAGIEALSASDSSSVFSGSSKAHSKRDLAAAWSYDRARSHGVPAGSRVRVRIRWGAPIAGVTSEATWNAGSDHPGVVHFRVSGEAFPGTEFAPILRRMRVYRFDPNRLADATQIQSGIELERDGGNLAGVIERLRDESPERFQELNDSLGDWIPDFDQISFDWPSAGHKAVSLRTVKDSHRVPASQLSDGTLLSLGLLVLAHQPTPPPLIGIEEPEHGLHPRLMKPVRDALHRLSHPDEFGESRAPTQVLATTHSPYFLDLFRDRPEDVMIANRVGNQATFSRLSEHPNFDEIVADVPLGDVWFTGVLGGVPIKP